MKNMRNSSSSRISRLLDHLVWLGAGITLGVLSLSFFLAADIYDFEDTVRTDSLPGVDAIVCLGGGRGRISAAADLWYRYWEKNQAGQSVKVPLLYFAGLGRQMNWNILAKHIRKGVAQVLQTQNVYIDRESSNTETNARWLVLYAQSLQWDKVVLLTSGYHMKRARFIFEKVLSGMGNPIHVETYSVYQEPFAAGQWRRDINGVRVTLIEYFKWIYYRLRF